MGVNCENKSWRIGRFTLLSIRESLYNEDCQIFSNFEKNFNSSILDNFEESNFFKLFLNKHINLGIMHIFMCMLSLNAD